MKIGPLDLTEKQAIAAGILAGAVLTGGIALMTGAITMDEYMEILKFIVITISGLVFFSLAKVF